MDTRDTRRELGRSARLLVGEERWLFVGFLVGGAGYLIWLAGTGVAVSRVATLAVGSYSVDPWSGEATALVVAFALLWVVLPSAVAVRYVTANVTNLRGNVEQYYRFDRPPVALVPPLVALAGAVAFGVARGDATSGPLVALGVANTLLLVRTVAYSYRVYSFSTPRLLRALVFLAAVVATTATATRTSSLAGQTALVEAAAAHYGVTETVFGTVVRVGVSAPLLPLAAVATPGVLALAYVCLQLFASLVVRARRPDVPRSAVRAGQRYPQVVRPGTSDRFATGTASSTGDADGGADTGARTGSESGEAGADGASGRSDDTAESGPTDGSGSTGDNVSQTRVYTPPEDDEKVAPDSAADGSDAQKNEFCPICGETYAAHAGYTNCPNCNAVLERD